MDLGATQVWTEPEASVGSIFLAARDCRDASSAAFVGSRQEFSFGLATLVLSCSAVEAFLNAWALQSTSNLHIEDRESILRNVKDRNFSIYKKLIEWPKGILGADLPERAIDHPPFSPFVEAYQLRAAIMHFQSDHQVVTAGRFVFDRMVNVTKLQVSSSDAGKFFSAAEAVVREILSIEFNQPGYPEDIEASFHAWTGRG